MAFKLDDFLSKKKEPTQVLDLSRVKITSKEEFKKQLDKVPEFKIKVEKVPADSIKIRDKDFSFVSRKRDDKHRREWNFPDPTPPDMRGVKLEDLCSVNIDWKMLTTLRPRTKMEEEMFSRLVQLGKLDLKYQQALQREKNTDWIRKTKNPRSSIVEVRILSCKECGEDFCDGSLCCKLTYDHFSRAQASSASDAIKILKMPESNKGSNKGSKKGSKKRKRRSRKRKRSRAKGMKPKKNSIFNRPPTKGCNRDHSRRGSPGNGSKPRSSSLNRIQSGRKQSFPSLRRSRSAPRLELKRKNKSEYLSDSCPTQTDYSSQSDSEGYTHCSNSPRKRSLARVGFVDDYNSDTGACSPATRARDRCWTVESDASDDSILHTSGPIRSRSQSGSPPKWSFTRSSKCPTTIQIEFDGLRSASGVFFPRKSYPLPCKSVPVRHLDSSPSSMPKNQEITKIVEGFTRIDLSFTDDPPSTSRKVENTVTTSPKRVSSRFSRSSSKPKREYILPSPHVKGQSLLGKYLNRKNKNTTQTLPHNFPY